MKLYTMSYKERQVQRQGLIEASSLERAEELGRGWCERAGGAMYIGVRDAVLVREEAVQQQKPPEQPVSAYRKAV